ncbi:cytochrome P450 [Backusella circina FSU 941]|nr:cytochrome P450 [Backusella circina FSU 941]
MDTLQSSYLEVSFKNLTNIYNSEIVLRLTKRNKIVAISAAIILIISYKINNIIRPPRKLLHIPHQGFFNFFLNLLRNEPTIQRAQRYSLPLINSKNSNGLYSDLFPKVPQPSSNNSTMLYKFAGSTNMLASSGGEHWKNQRMVANPAFHRSMPVKLFGKLTQQLFQEINKMGPAVNVPDLMGRWTLDAIGKAGFGFNFNALSDRDNEWVMRYNNIIKNMIDPLYFMLPALDVYFLWMLPKRRQAHEELAKFKDMLRNVIAEGRKKVESGQTQNENLEENEKDLLTLMLESEIQGEGRMTNDELEHNINIFFLAGHDTTSNALSSAICYLALNTSVQQRAREEALSILGNESRDIIPTIEDIKRMEYINQIIKETLRVCGPVPETLPRYSVEDCELVGSFIPKGTWLTANIYETMHSEKNWKNPLEFNPDRFAPGGEASQQDLKGMTWVPFGNGPRQCIGMNFSLTEQRVLLSMLLRKYTWVLPKDSIHKDGLIATGLAMIGPHNLNVEFTKRY